MSDIAALDIDLSQYPVYNQCNLFLKEASAVDKKVYCFVDDVIWTLQELHSQRPASIFEQHFLKNLKIAHERYGAKFQLNLFYRTDFYYGHNEFTLADMTDAYREEFTAASDWLKFSFHSKQEFPDYPFVNATYEDTKAIFQEIRDQVFRFAGENSFGYGVTPHWGPLSKAACLALRDCGVKVMWCSSGNKCPYDGDPNILPYGHAGRLLQNRQTETMLFTRVTKDAAITRSICGYNHISEETAEAIQGTLQTVLDAETGIRFKPLEGGGVIINLVKDEEVEHLIGEKLGDEFVCLTTHEQYSYPNYFAYQPTHAARILRACELVARNGYEFIYFEELGK